MFEWFEQWGTMRSPMLKYVYQPPNLFHYIVVLAYSGFINISLDSFNLLNLFYPLGGIFFSCIHLLINITRVNI